MNTLKDYTNRQKPRDVTIDFRPVRRKLVRACEAPEPMELGSSAGLQTVRKGDFVVQDEDGDVVAMPPESFRKVFSFADAPAPAGFGTAKPAAPTPTTVEAVASAPATKAARAKK